MPLLAPRARILCPWRAACRPWPDPGLPLSPGMAVVLAPSASPGAPRSPPGPWRLPGCPACAPWRAFTSPGTGEAAAGRAHGRYGQARGTAGSSPPGRRGEIRRPGDGRRRHGARPAVPRRPCQAWPGRRAAGGRRCRHCAGARRPSRPACSGAGRAHNNIPPPARAPAWTTLRGARPARLRRTGGPRSLLGSRPESACPPHAPRRPRRQGA